MAEVGKVFVSIEARLGALESGLAKAELSVRKAGDRIAAGQASLGRRISRSWTEMSSKLSIYTKLMETVTASIQAIAAMGPAFDNALSPEESNKKIGELVEKLEQIPLGIGAAASAVKEMILLFTGWGKQTAQLLKDTKEIEDRSQKRTEHARLRNTFLGQSRVLEARVNEANLGGSKDPLEKMRATQEAEVITFQEVSRERMRRWDEENKLRHDAAGFEKRNHEEQRSMFSAQMGHQFQLLVTRHRVAEAGLKELLFTQAQAKEEERLLKIENDRLGIQSERERVRQEELSDLEKQRSELEKLIEKEKKRISGRPDVTTGSIQTALGSFTIAMPEGQRIQKAQLEKLEDLRELLRNIERQMRKMNDRSMGDFPVIPAA